MQNLKAVAMGMATAITTLFWSNKPNQAIVLVKNQQIPVLFWPMRKII
jgi:hypothetical protein